MHRWSSLSQFEVKNSPIPPVNIFDSKHDLNLIAEKALKNVPKLSLNMTPQVVDIL